MSASFHLHFIVYFMFVKINASMEEMRGLRTLVIVHLGFGAVLGSPCPASVYPHHDFICSVEVLHPGRF